MLERSLRADASDADSRAGRVEDTCAMLSSGMVMMWYAVVASALPCSLSYGNHTSESISLQYCACACACASHGQHCCISMTAMTTTDMHYCNACENLAAASLAA